MPAATVEVSIRQAWRQAARTSDPVLKDVSFMLAANQRLAILGPNGAGKSTLLLTLVGATSYEGQIRIGEIELGARSLDAVRERLGYVFEDPSEQLFMPTVEEEVAFGPQRRGARPEQIEQQVNDALHAVGLNELRKRLPTTLSLGQQRRLAIATALACAPDLLLVDEPTANLDPQAREELLVTLASVRSTVIFATHDLDAALDIADSVLFLKCGEREDFGPAAELLRDEPRLKQAGLGLPLSLKPRAVSIT